MCRGELSAVIARLLSIYFQIPTLNKYIIDVSGQNLEITWLLKMEECTERESTLHQARAL